MSVIGGNTRVIVEANSVYHADFGRRRTSLVLPLLMLAFSGFPVAEAGAQTINCTTNNGTPYTDGTVSTGASSTTICQPSNNDGLWIVANPNKSGAGEDLVLAGGGANGNAVHQFFRANNDTVGQMKIYVGDPNVTGTSIFLYGNVNLGGKAMSGVAAATLSATSTDAVIGSQLFSTNQSLATTTTTANGALQRSGGTMTGAINMNAKALNGLAAATLSATSTDAVAGSQLFATNQSLTTTTTTANGALQRSGGTMTGAINMNAKALNGLTAATLSATSTDAVTGSQLFATNQSLATTTTTANNALQRSGGTMTGAINMGSKALNGLNAATLSATSTDAVTGSQLFATNQSLATTTTTANGALQRSGGTMTGAINMGSKALNGLVAATLSATSTDAVTGGQLFTTNQSLATTTTTANGALQRSGGTMTGAINMGAKALTGLTAATLSATSTDAVAGSQLFATNQQLTTTTTTANNALQRSGGTMTGAINMNAKALTGLTAATLSASSTDAVTGSQLFATNQQVATFSTTANGALQRSGGVMTGALNMNGQILNGLAPATLSATSTEAVSGSQLYAVQQAVNSAGQTASGALQRSGGTMTGAINMNSAALYGLRDGDLSASSSDAVTGAQLFATNQSLSATGVAAAGALQRSGGAMQGTLNMNGNALTGLVEASLTAISTDAVTGSQLFNTNQQLAATTDTANGALQRSGGTMSGTLQMNGNSVTGLGNGSITATSTDAVNGSQVYALQSSINANATVADGALQRAGGTMTGAIDMGGNTLTGIAAPVQASDAVNKAYVDQTAAAVIAQQVTGAGSGSNSVQSQSSQATGNGAVALGLSQTAQGNGAVAIGDPNLAQGTGAVAIGAGNEANGDGAVALGQQNRAIGGSAIALGSKAMVTGTAGVAIGANTAAGQNALALGAGASANQTGATALGAGATTTRAGQLALGGAGSSVTIGDIAASTAAQSGGTAVATVDANGTLGQDTTIRPAIASLFASRDEQASQLQALQTSAALQNGRFSALETDVGSLRRDLNLNVREANGGIAAAMAMGGTIMPPDAKVAVSFNLATYRKQQGVSVSGVAKVGRHVYASGAFAGSTVRGSNAGRVGMTLAW